MKYHALRARIIQTLTSSRKPLSAHQLRVSLRWKAAREEIDRALFTMHRTKLLDRIKQPGAGAQKQIAFVFWLAKAVPVSMSKPPKRTRKKKPLHKVLGEALCARWA